MYSIDFICRKGQRESVKKKFAMEGEKWRSRSFVVEKSSLWPADPWSFKLRDEAVVLQ